MYDTSYSTSVSTTGEINPIVVIIYLIAIVITFVSMWKVFTKAGQPGWAVLVPFYNIYILLQIAGRPAWWLLLYLIPFVNLVVSIIVVIDIAKAFGKSALFGFFGLGLFGIVGYPILAFGNATYNGANPTDLTGTPAPTTLPPTPPATPPTA